MAQSGINRDGTARLAQAGFAPARAERRWTVAALWLAKCVRQEVDQRRLFPWLAVAYGLGITLAFAAEGPLALLPPALAAGTFAIGGVLLRGRLDLLVIMLAGTALFSGFAATVIRMSVVAAPVLQSLTLTKMGGFVETVEERRAGGRLVLRVGTA